MSVVITGEQFVESGELRGYSVSGIPVGFTLDSLVMPSGWSIDTTGPITAGSQYFVLNVAIGSGTIIATYVSAGLYQVGYFDVYSSACRMGEEIVRAGIFVPVVNPLIPVAFCDADTCTYSLPVLADPDDPTNKLNNDKSEFYLYGNTSTLAIVLTLQKFEGGSFSDIEILIDNSYGRFFAYGKHPDFSGNNFTDDYGKKYTGIFLDWLLVYLDYGAGRYRMKIEYTDIFSTVVTAYSKSDYCLSKYNCHYTEGTIRIETLNQGLRGTLADMDAQIDYSTGWNGAIRLRGTIEQLDPGYNKEYNQYGDASRYEYLPIVDEQVPKYKVQIKPVPGWLDWYVSTNVLQADRILLTDYNSRGRHPILQVPVKDGTFKTIAKDVNNPLAGIELEFAYGLNNLRRRNS